MRFTILTLLVFFSPAALGNETVVSDLPTKPPWSYKSGTISDASLALNLGLSVALGKTWEDRGASLLNHLINFGINWGAKKLFQGSRPDDSSARDGMPSGHSQLSMGGAGQICAQQSDLLCGLSVGLGLTTMAGRIGAGRHTPEQTLAGGAAGFPLGYYGEMKWVF